MGFRFRNLNAIHRIYIARACSSPNPLTRSPNHLLQDPSLVVPRRWHLGHSSHGHDGDDRGGVYGKDGERIFKLGLASDVGLAAGKALTGWLSGSTAIIADAAHSVSDVVLSGIALVSFKVASTPKDEEHPYGHGKFETLGALGISCMLLATAGGIAWHAFDLLLGLLSADHQIANQLIQDHGHRNQGGGHRHGVDMDYPVLALTMTIMSISVKEGLYWITKRAGERQNSGLMIANAWHHRADAISSVVALIGVGGSILGVKFLDPLAGVVVSGMILKAGLETGYQSVLELVDAAIPSKQLDPIRQTILQVEGVKGCHRMRGRRAGSFLYLDVHIVVDPFCSVSAAHDIGENVRNQIHRSHPEVAEVFIHIDPEISPCVLPEQENPKTPKFDKNLSAKENDIDIEAAVSSIISSKFLEDMVLPEQENPNTPKFDKNLSAKENDIDIEAAVSSIISSKFLEMVVEHITRHSLQGKVLLQIEVSMPSDMLIRDAMEVAKRAEEDILEADPDIVHASIQLRLGHPFPQSNHNQH